MYVSLFDILSQHNLLHLYVFAVDVYQAKLTTMVWTPCSPNTRGVVRDRKNGAIQLRDNMRSSGQTVIYQVRKAGSFIGTTANIFRIKQNCENGAWWSESVVGGRTNTNGTPLKVTKLISVRIFIFLGFQNKKRWTLIGQCAAFCDNPSSTETEVSLTPW